jgi:hypothetical protein
MRILKTKSNFREEEKGETQKVGQNGISARSPNLAWLKGDVTEKKNATPFLAALQKHSAALMPRD